MEKTNTLGDNWFKYFVIFTIVNILLALAITINNIYAVQAYFDELVLFMLIAVLTIAVVLLLNLGLSILPSVVGSYKYNWPEEKQQEMFFKTFIICTSIFVGGTCLVLLIFYYPYFPILATEDILYATWWFSSFTFAVLLIFLLYVYRVFKQTAGSN